MTEKKTMKHTIGWKDKIDFIDFGFNNLPVKIDTGANTSAFHCSSIELITIKRKQFVKFTPLDASYEEFEGKEFTLPFHKFRTIKNSFGQEEDRFVVLTNAKIFGEIHPIEISLTERSNLEFPVLLGRRFLRNKCVVDVARTNLSYKNKIKEG